MRSRAIRAHFFTWNERRHENDQNQGGALPSTSGGSRVNAEFDAYLNLHAIGVWYKSTLPVTLQNAIDAYNSDLYYYLGGSTFHVRNGAAAPPGGAAPATLNGLFAMGGAHVAPAQPAALAPGALLGAELVNLSAAMSGTLLGSASPFIYIHPHNPGVNVNYGSAVTVTRFLAAWEQLVLSSANQPVNFVWPPGGGWNAHEKVEFAAAALAETYRDPAQLGAIFLLTQRPFRSTFAAENVWTTLPMCQGGSYNPMLMRVGLRQEVLMASTQVFQRCYRISQKSVAVPTGLNAPGVLRVSQGRSMSGTIAAYQWELSSKHYRKRVRYWYYL
jgi:hypothetical protein